MDITTLEQAQEEILRLQGELSQITTERDTLSQNNETLTNQLNESRTLCQKFFNQLRAGTDQNREENQDDEKEPPSCEDYALTLNIL